jgi:hypothetical protein
VAVEQRYTLDGSGSRVDHDLEWSVAVLRRHVEVEVLLMTVQKD